MPHTILLIEDNDTDARVVQDVLHQSTQEWQVTRVRTMAEATQRLAEMHYDLVLMDLGLPDVQGSMAVLAFFDAYPSGRRLPPIVVLPFRFRAELPEETPPDPPGRGGWGGCSSYQRLSKFAGSFPDPILNPGLRGNRKKTCQGWICEKNTKKGSKNRCF